MTPDLRRAVRFSALAVSVIALPAAAVELAVPRIGLEAGLGAVAAPSAVVGAVLPGLSGAAAPLSPALAAPSAAPLFAPALHLEAAAALPAAAAAPAPALAPAPAAAPSASGALSAPAAVAARRSASVSAPSLEILRQAAASRGESGARFDGSRAAAPADSVFVVNDEGIRINERAAAYYREVRRMTELYKGQLDLSESLDVMDDAYGDVLAKISAVEAIAKGRGLTGENTHLEETLVWVDGVLNDGRKKVAVHTHRVFFHHAKNPRSEIAEGIRRVDGYIRDAEAMFARGGKAEEQLGRLDEIELVFDSRGYSEIKEHLKKRGAELSARTNGRISFKYLDELAPLPREQAEIRSRLNDLVRRYEGAGLSKIIEGVIYSRYVGLLLELKTLEHYHKLGYQVLQSGRELFDADGMYVSELDAVVRSPEGKVVLVEAKSARVGLPAGEVLRDKVIYKLETYKKFKAQLDAMIGRPFDEVVFAMDVAVDPEAAAAGRLTERDQRKLELVEFLRSKEPELSKRYGFPVSFLFLQSGPRDGGANFRSRGGQRRGR